MRFRTGSKLIFFGVHGLDLVPRVLIMFFFLVMQTYIIFVHGLDNLNLRVMITFFGCRVNIRYATRCGFFNPFVLSYKLF